MDSRGRIGPIELLLYAVVAAYIAACIHVFSSLLRFQYGVELIVILAGMAAFLWLAGLSVIVPGILRYLALFDAARGISKAGSGIREWGRSQRDRVRSESEEERRRGGPPYYR